MTTMTASLNSGLLDVMAMAELLDCSPRHVRRMADSGLMPRPVHIGRLIGWQRLEIEKWIAAGCPSCRAAKGGAR